MSLGFKRFGNVDGEHTLCAVDSKILMTKDQKTTPMKDFLDKFFELCKEYQQDISPHKMAEILRNYADRLD